MTKYVKIKSEITGFAFTEAVKTIYTECNFDAGAYAHVEFCVKAPDDASQIDSAEMNFYKADNKMSYSGEFFNGPNFGEYAVAVKEICDTDEFFTSRE